MKLEEAFGVVLRKYRKEKGFSQELLASVCDLDRTFISLLERGKRRPTIHTMIQLAEGLHIDADILLRDAIRHQELASKDAKG